MNRLTDERLNTLEFTAEECMDGQVRFDIMALCEELRARRVRDADLRALIECAKTTYHFPCVTCRLRGTCWPDNEGDCRAALLAHFGLAEPEVRNE